MDQTGFDLVCKLPNTGIEAFGCLQNFIYTGQVYGIKSGDSIPDFSVLFRAWKLAKTLKMAHLQTNLLDCMAVRRYHMRCIPSITNIKEVGETLKRDVLFALSLLNGWQSIVCAAVSPPISTLMHLVRDGYEVTAFAKLLPKEILSELCMFMARLPANLTPSRAKVRLPKKRERNHSLDDDAYEPGTSSEEERAPMRRGCVGAVNRDLDFCRCLIDRILSRPGFWARFAKPFK
jgi:hypothetical protein